MEGTFVSRAISTLGEEKLSLFLEEVEKQERHEHAETLAYAWERVARVLNHNLPQIQEYGPLFHAIVEEVRGIPVDQQTPDLLRQLEGQAQYSRPWQSELGPDLWLLENYLFEIAINPTRNACYFPETDPYWCWPERFVADELSIGWFFKAPGPDGQLVYYTWVEQAKYALQLAVRDKAWLGVKVPAKDFDGQITPLTEEEFQNVVVQHVKDIQRAMELKKHFIATILVEWLATDKIAALVAEHRAQFPSPRKLEWEFKLPILHTKSKGFPDYQELRIKEKSGQLPDLVAIAGVGETPLEPRLKRVLTTMGAVQDNIGGLEIYSFVAKNFKAAWEECWNASQKGEVENEQQNHQ